MKKNDYDFTIPNRQSYIAIILILFKTISVVVRQVIPILFVILIGGSSKKGDYILWAVIVVAICSMIYSIINFFRTYFLIQGEELILHTGVLQRKKTSIQINRIQTINFEQNIIHQIFKVLKLKIDTAGSDKNEFEIHAIDADKAQAFRSLILKEKALYAESEVESNQGSNGVDEAIFSPIMSLGNLPLLKVGLTENHIKSGGFIFIFFFWLYQNLQEIGVDVDEYSTQIPNWEMGLYSILVIGAIFIIFSIIISLVRTVIQHFDLQFLRSKYGFKVISGLFTKREISALDHKIQHISWSDNLLKKIAGFKDLSLNQASSSELNSKQNITIPGCNEMHIKGVVTTLFGETNFSEFAMQPIDRRYFTRFSVIVSVILSILTGLIMYFFDQKNIIVIILVFFYLIVSRYISFKKKAFGYNDDLIYIKGGTFGDKAEILPMYKIQAINLHQSPYQKRNNLCSMTLYTASGNIGIPYISKKIGSQLTDLLIYKVEVDKRKWM